MRKKENEQFLISKIHNEYTSGDCVQIMLTYDNSMTVVGNEGVIYHATDLEDIDIHKYITDDRRKKFPLCDIPMHYEREFLRKRIFVNQLFNYNQPYVIVHDGIPEKIIVSKVDDNSFLIQNIPRVTESDILIEPRPKQALKRLVTEDSIVIDNDGKICDIWLPKEKCDKDRIEFIKYLEKNNIYYEFGSDGSIRYSSVRTSVVPNSFISSSGQKCLIIPNNNDFDIKMVSTKKLYNNLTCAKVYDLTYNIQDHLNNLNELKDQVKYLKAPKVKKKVLKKL